MVRILLASKIHRHHLSGKLVLFVMSNSQISEVRIYFLLCVQDKCTSYTKRVRNGPNESLHHPKSKKNMPCETKDRAKTIGQKHTKVQGYASSTSLRNNTVTIAQPD